MIPPIRILHPTKKHEQFVVDCTIALERYLRRLGGRNAWMVGRDVHIRKGNIDRYHLAPMDFMVTMEEATEGCRRRLAEYQLPSLKAGMKAALELDPPAPVTLSADCTKLVWTPFECIFVEFDVELDAYGEARQPTYDRTSVHTVIAYASARVQEGWATWRSAPWVAPSNVQAVGHAMELRNLLRQLGAETFDYDITEHLWPEAVLDAWDTLPVFEGFPGS